MIVLSPSQWKIVRHSGNLFIMSVPGAGKTRIVQAKALQEAARIVGSSKRVACLTYTNAAADEMERRILPALSEEERGSIFVGTLHSFCIHEILAPHAGRLTELPAGHVVVTPEDPVAEALIADLLGAEPTSADLHNFAGVARGAHGQALPNDALSQQLIESYWAGLVERGRIDFSGVLYYSSLLLSRFVDVAASVCGSFSWIIVDEYQDTSTAQLSILRLLSAAGHAKWLLIGDFNQSIYGFNGVSPEALTDFATSLGAVSVSLTTTYRCPSIVIQHANNLISTPKMRPNRRTVAGEAYNFSGDISACVGSYIQLLTDKGIGYGDAAIIAPFRKTLMKAQAGLSALLPPAPWSAQFPFPGRSAVVTCIAATLAYASHDHEVHLSDAVQQLSSLAGRGLAGSLERLATLVVIRVADRMREMNLAELFIIDVARTLVEECSRIIPRPFHRDIESRFEVALRPSILKGSPLMTWTAADIARIGCCHSAVTLATIHGAKGLQFPYVLFLGFEKGAIPFSRAADYSEEVRKAYVTITRSSLVLMYGFRPNRESPLWQQATGI